VGQAGDIARRSGNRLETAMEQEGGLSRRTQPVGQACRAGAHRARLGRGFLLTPQRSSTHRRRSTRRHRAILSTAGSGPASTTAFIAAICPSLSFGRRPGAGRLHSPAMPSALSPLGARSNALAAEPRRRSYSDARPHFRWTAAAVGARIKIAEAMVEGRTYTARSRHGPANELARQLVAEGRYRADSSGRPIEAVPTDESKTGLSRFYSA
jgi:hypothetical protein